MGSCLPTCCRRYQWSDPLAGWLPRPRRGVELRRQLVAPCLQGSSVALSVRLWKGTAAALRGRAAGRARLRCLPFPPRGRSTLRSRQPLPETVGLQLGHVGHPSEAARLELPRELRDHVEAAGLRGPVESTGERCLNLVFTLPREALIAPRLPHAGANTPDFGPTRILDRACFLDPPRILGCRPGFRFRRREASGPSARSSQERRRPLRTHAPALPWSRFRSSAPRA